MFNIENEINNWKKSLKSNKIFETGDIEELECHLRDIIEKYQQKSFDEKEAFEKAIIELGEISEVSNEYYYSEKEYHKIKMMNSKLFIVALLPNYIKLSLRNIQRKRAFSFINITGLALGLCSFMFISYFVMHLESYDNFHRDAERVFRVNLDFITESTVNNYALSQPTLAEALRDKLPEVEFSARLFMFESRRIVKHKTEKFYEDGFAYADPELFKILSLPFVSGDPNNALNSPDALVIPERLEKKYFGNESGYGKTLLVNDREFKVTGIIKDLPVNTHLMTDIFLSMKELRNPPWLSDWTWPGMFTYVKLKDKTSLNIVNSKIKTFADEYLVGNPRAFGKKYEYYLQPVKEIYLGEELEFDVAKADPSYPFVFSAIGLFILIIACINFTNLSSSRAAERAIEIGLRKTIGAQKLQLVIQFLGETVVMSLLSFIISVILLFTLKPVFEDLTEVQFVWNRFIDAALIIKLGILILIIGILSGIYPALILSSFKPTEILRNKKANAKGGVIFRKTLVVIQFSISIILIMGTIIGLKQISYMQSQSVGFNKNQKLVLPVRGRMPLIDNYEFIKNSFQKLNSVHNVCVSANVPGQGAGSINTKLASKIDHSGWDMYYSFIDDDFLPSYKIEILAGRNFSTDFITDQTSSNIINEKAAKLLGFANPVEAVGRKIISGLNHSEKEIIGVVKNYHIQSLKYDIDPLILEYAPQMFSSLTLELAGNSIPKSLNEIEEKWNELFPNKPFEYFFLDESFDDLYKEEIQRANLFSVFAGLAIFIACLGLFGLASYSAEARTKEIGIRKTLGASVESIIRLFTFEFIVWVVIANIIAWPVSWFLFDSWLNDFAFRISIGIDIYLITFLVAMIISIFAISFQSIKASLSNPVKSLRYE